MKIFINEDIVEFTLGNEENYQEIKNQLKSWLNQHNMFITSLLVNEKKDQDLSDDLPIESIDTIKIYTIPQYKKDLEDLEVIFHYFELVKEALEKDNFFLLSDLGNEYNFIIGGIESLFKEPKDSERFIIIHKTITEIFNQTKQKDLKTIDSDLKLRGINTISQVCLLLKIREQEINNPEEELKSSLKYINEIQPDLLNISVILQSGKDKEAVKLILCLTEFLQKITRIFQIMIQKEIQIENLEMEDFQMNLNSVLHEMEEAFVVQDTVLIGDLIEYEILPQIDQLGELKIFTLEG